ncbi:HEAT repeat domain-containing protein [Candidatus Aerophobetes bacterium]|nr:HEAT repeat domain-containing protein [Candidatus Aerophobetes bacterium]
MDDAALKFVEIKEMAKSKDEEERRKAAHLLGDLKDKRGVEILIILLQDPCSAVREAASYALKKIGGEEVIKKLISLIYSEEAYIRNTAIEILEEIGEEGVEDIASLLKDKDHDIRKFACDMLGNVKSPRAVSYLISTLDDYHINVACAACEALGNIRDKAATGALIRVITQKKDKWLTCYAIEALGKIKDPRATEVLMDLSSSDDPLILFALVKAFGEIKDGQMIRKLFMWLEAPSLSGAALETLARIAVEDPEKIREALVEKPEKLDIIRSFLKDPTWGAKKSAALLLGAARDREAVPLLVSLLDENDEKTREEAVKALLQIDPELTTLPSETKENTRELLEALIYDNDEKMRKLAREALERFGSSSQDLSD